MLQHHFETPTSSLVLCDRLLTLAHDAGLAGFQATADRLVMLAHRVCDEPARPTGNDKSFASFSKRSAS